jgi:CBS domain-containing membrane protein
MPSAAEPRIEDPTRLTRLRVRDLMTWGTFAVRAKDDLATVSDLMDEHSVRHIPVVDGEGRLLGLVSHRDLLRSALRGQPGLPPEIAKNLLLATTAGQIMTRDPRTAGPEDDIRQAAQVMLDHKYGCLPVVENGRLVGIITESDFVRFLAAGD